MDTTYSVIARDKRGYPLVLLTGMGELDAIRLVRNVARIVGEEQTVWLAVDKPKTVR